MITFSNKTYAKNDKEMVNSLFTPGGTCAGFYKKLKNGFLILDLQKNPFAFIVSNKKQGYFVVNATKTKEGKLFYNYSTSEEVERILGIDNKPYSFVAKECESCSEF